MDYDVLILGAGISGICAAKILSKQDLSVHVLEARSRPGGRIHSVVLKNQVHDNDSNHFDDISTFNQKLENDDDVYVDLGANYLIGCNRVQSDQPLYHIAKTLQVPSSVAAGDLMKKYRGWECVELSSWRDFDGNPLSREKIGEAVFFFDRVLSFAMHYHRVEKFQRQLSPSTIRPKLTFENIFEAAKEKILKTEYSIGLRESAFLSELDSKIFDSITVRYLSYVNPMNRLSRVLYDNLSSAPHDDCDLESLQKRIISSEKKKNGRQLVSWRYDDMIINNCLSTHYSSSSSTTSEDSNSSAFGEDIIDNLSSLAHRLATTYPTKEDRDSYYAMLDAKFNIISSTDNSRSSDSPCPQVKKDRSKKKTYKRKTKLQSRSSETSLDSSIDISQTSMIDVERYSRLSLPHTTDDIGVCWEDRLMTNRFNELIEPIVDKLSITYNKIVKRIDWNDTNPSHRPVSILVEDRITKEQSVYYARHVICTLPVGVLKGLSEVSRVTFLPPLPDWKMDAINRLGIPKAGADNHEKIILKFRSEDVFWDKDAVHLKCPDPRLHILNLHRYGKEGVLCGHIWGGSGLNTSENSDQEIIEIILKFLYAMYPTTSKRNDDYIKPVSHIITRWSSDPFALGSYTSGEADSVESDRLNYAKTLNDKDNVPRLFFAGEATLNSEQAQECTHGALITGLDRSFELIEYLGSKNLLPKKNLNDPQTLKCFLSLIRIQPARYLLDKRGKYSSIQDGNVILLKRRKKMNTSLIITTTHEDSETDACVDEANLEVVDLKRPYLEMILEDGIDLSSQSPFENICDIEKHSMNEICLQTC